MLLMSRNHFVFWKEDSWIEFVQFQELDGDHLRKEMARCARPHDDPGRIDVNQIRPMKFVFLIVEI